MLGFTQGVFREGRWSDLIWVYPYVNSNRNVHDNGFSRQLWSAHCDSIFVMKRILSYWNSSGVIPTVWTYSTEWRRGEAMGSVQYSNRRNRWTIIEKLWVDFKLRISILAERLSQKAWMLLFSYRSNIRSVIGRHVFKK